MELVERYYSFPAFSTIFHVEILLMTCVSWPKTTTGNFKMFSIDTISCGNGSLFQGLNVSVVFCFHIFELILVKVLLNSKAFPFKKQFVHSKIRNLLLSPDTFFQLNSIYKTPNCLHSSQRLIFMAKFFRAS